MAVINVVLIRGKLKISPLRFLRKDLGSTRRSKAVRLPNFKFFNRFRIRILIQNRASYLTLFIGIVFANILLLFGMMMSRSFLITRRRPSTTCWQNTSIS